MIKLVIYDYDNRVAEIELNAVPEDILSISVAVISGDEVGTIYFKDGGWFDFDADDGNRTVDFHDGTYCVSPDAIVEWLNWRPQRDDRKSVFSYARMEQFYDRFADDL